MNTANNQLNTYIFFIAISIIYVRNYAKWKGWLKIKWNQIACTWKKDHIQTLVMDTGIYYRESSTSFYKIIMWIPESVYVEQSQISTIRSIHKIRSFANLKS